MSSAVEEFVLARIAGAPVRGTPFPHCVIDGVFPAEFYEDIIDAWPEDAEFMSLSDTGRVTGKYDERKVVLLPGGLARLAPARRDFWAKVFSWLESRRVVSAVVGKFRGELEATGFNVTERPVSGDALIVSDRTLYSLGPHTDSPRKVVSALFYLPEDATFKSFGTSFYEPLDGNFRCPGGPHYKRQGFRLVETIPFLPNRLVMFPKSDCCFHGVEPVDLPGIDRRLLIFDVFRADLAALSA
jgi:hypothetical protein